MGEKGSKKLPKSSVSFKRCAQVVCTTCTILAPGPPLSKCVTNKEMEHNPVVTSTFNVNVSNFNADLNLTPLLRVHFTTALGCHRVGFCLQNTCSTSEAHPFAIFAFPPPLKPRNASKCLPSRRSRRSC
ncbi:hypothetical protein K443DRAFT_224645 [Laccaria amethystina LaAM-08-1]|uniref:Uncharacterized protein n=1 Tax=Laccaria amethystina LaAM-08-1 TaxID=1095629 RepID=A0A0C9XK36_9AGAR|nr:hypothetical protein K443DRAFT_224645 [Laccaria amethystina LaAM-08-1]